MHCSKLSGPSFKRHSSILTEDFELCSGKRIQTDILALVRKMIHDTVLMRNYWTRRSFSTFTPDDHQINTTPQLSEVTKFDVCFLKRLFGAFFVTKHAS